MDEKAIGMSVPIATPTRPNGLISSALSARLTRPVAMLTNASVPDLAGALEQRGARWRCRRAARPRTARIWMTGAAPSISGLPTHARISGSASTHQHQRDRHHGRERQPRPLEQQPLQPRRSCCVASESTMTGKSTPLHLVGQPLRAGDDPVGHGPDRHRRRCP